MDNNNGWSEWRHYTLAELKRLNDTIEKIEEHNKKTDLWVSVEIAKLKIYASVWGSVAGFIGGIILMILVKVITG